MSHPPTVDGLVQELSVFARERDWDQFHTPKNLAMALMVEAAELLEIYQWQRPKGATLTRLLALKLFAPATI